MVTITSSERLLALGSTLGMLVGIAGAALVARPPLLQQVLQYPTLTSIGVVVLVLATMLSIAGWARSPAHPERWSFAVAISAAGGLVALANGVAPAVGWWGGPAFQAPRLVQALLYGLGVMGLFALLLLGYRWVAVRSPRLAVLAYGLFMVAMMLTTIIGDASMLGTGWMVFSGGYTIWMDVGVGVIIFWFPLIVYTLLTRRSGVHTHRALPES